MAIAGLEDLVYKTYHLTNSPLLFLEARARVVVAQVLAFVIVQNQSMMGFQVLFLGSWRVVWCLIVVLSDGSKWPK